MAVIRFYTHKNRSFKAVCGFDGRYIVDVCFWELKPNRKIFKYKYYGSKSFLIDEEMESLTEEIRTRLIQLIIEEEQEEKLQKIRKNFKKGIDK